MNEPKRAAYTTRPAYRAVSAILGIAFWLIGGYLLTGQSPDALQIFAALILWALGGNLVLSAWRGSASWVAKIGPLP